MFPAHHDMVPRMLMQMPTQKHVRHPLTRCENVSFGQHLAHGLSSWVPLEMPAICAAWDAFSRAP